MSRPYCMLGHEWRNHEHKVLPLPPSVDGLGRLSGSEMPRRAARWGANAAERHRAPYPWVWAGGGVSGFGRSPGI